MPTADSHFGFDPVAAFLRRPLHEIVGSQAPPLILPTAPVPPSIPALWKLATEYAWAAVLDLSTSLLAASDDSPEGEDAPRPHERMLCTMYRALALLQTRQVDRAADAIDHLGDLSSGNPEYCYETYPKDYPDYIGSFVPFELKLLALEVRVQRGDATAIVDAYTLKRQVCEQEEDVAIATERHAVLLSALASFHLKAQQHDAAVDLSRQLVDLCPESNAWYMYGRVLLHVGDLEAAELAFAEAQTTDKSRCETMRRAHKGMLLAASGKYSEAVVEYEEAAQHIGDKGKLGVLIANNVAICLMHIGRLAEAVDRLEGVLRRGPEIALDEGLVFNLATLYDLAYPDSAAEKKRILQRLASRFGRQGFDLENVGL